MFVRNVAVVGRTIGALIGNINRNSILWPMPCAAKNIDNPRADFVFRKSAQLMSAFWAMQATFVCTIALYTIIIFTMGNSYLQTKKAHTLLLSMFIRLIVSTRENVTRCIFSNYNSFTIYISCDRLTSFSHTRVMCTCSSTHIFLRRM